MVRGPTGKGYEKLSGEMEIFYIMKEEGVSCVHLLVNTVHLTREF